MARSNYRGYMTGTTGCPQRDAAINYRMQHGIGSVGVSGRIAAGRQLGGTASPYWSGLGSALGTGAARDGNAPANESPEERARRLYLGDPQRPRLLALEQANAAPSGPNSAGPVESLRSVLDKLEEAGVSWQIATTPGSEVSPERLRFSGTLTSQALERYLMGTFGSYDSYLLDAATRGRVYELPERTRNGATVRDWQVDLSFEHGSARQFLRRVLDANPRQQAIWPLTKALKEHVATLTGSSP